MNHTTHTLSEQIQGIQDARKLLVASPVKINFDEIDSRLNDAGSTLAAINLTKHLPDEGREEYYVKIMNITTEIKHVQSMKATNGNLESLVKHEEIMKSNLVSMSYDVIQSQSTELKEKEKRIAQLEKGLREAACVLRMATLIDKSNTCEKAMVQAESLLNKTN